MEMAANGKGIRIALAGNPNCGKTTIFNNITGARQHVGNYAGVTVEKKEGECTFEGQELLFIDLPGTYSLTARSMDELVARNTIINDEPDVIVNVLDASNLERNLYLAAQLVELETPLVMALNMTDVADEMGIRLDLKHLSSQFGATIVTTVGRVNQGTKDLLKAVCAVAEERRQPGVRIDYGAELEPRIEELTEVIRQCKRITYPVRWVAIKLLENDSDVVKKVSDLGDTETVLEKADMLRRELADKVDLDIIFQEQRHRFATQAYNEALLTQAGEIETRSDKIDKIITHKYLGLPIFMLIMWALFNLVFTIGAYPQDWLDQQMGVFGTWLGTVLPEGQLQSLIVDGIIGGVGAVLSFLPLILLMFLGISFLEDTGYMARAAFVVDRLMRACGLHGKSFIPMLLGFGCSVPAIMGARILDNPRDRMVTILVAPLMSCSARLPVYTLLIGAFFSASIAGSVLFGIYALGVIIAIILAKVFRRVLFTGESEPFVMEMPPYHMPTLRSVLRHMWDRAWLYIKKAGTFILAASILVWFLVSYPQNVQYSQDYDAAHEQVTAQYEQQEANILAPLGISELSQNGQLQSMVNDLTAEKSSSEVEAVNPQLFPAAQSIFENQTALDEANKQLDDEQKAEKIGQSYAAIFGKAIEPVIKPLGFDWRIGVSIVAATAAKEVMVSTLGTIYAVEASEDDDSSLQSFLAEDPTYSPLVALSMMVFALLYQPCLATLAVIKRETGSWKWVGFILIYADILAYGAAFITYQGGRFLGF